MDRQVDYFGNTRQDIVSRIGASAAQALLRNSLYFLLIGSNYIIFGEYLNGDVNQYVNEIVSNFKSELTILTGFRSKKDLNRLYNLDACKIVVSNAPKVESMPFEIDTHLCAMDCVSSLNEVTKLYNIKLKTMLEDLTNNLTGSIIILAICFGHNITAVFVFGDSLVEVGNNFYIDTVAKPVLPNGIDFPKGAPSGRYTNSRTIVDIIGKFRDVMIVILWMIFVALVTVSRTRPQFSLREDELGFKDYSPPFLAPNTSGDIILKGVNYASSGAGILQVTGSVFGERIWMDKQVNCFAKTRQDIISRIGAPAAQALLRHSLYVLVIGSNDILFEGNTQPFDVKSIFLDEVLSNLKSQLTRLYNLGARKFAMSNVPKVGCIPFDLDLHLCAEDCVSSINDLAKLYNSRLKSLLEDLTRSLPGSIFVYVDTYAITEDIIDNHRSYGFENADRACCEVIGKHGGLIPCIPVSRVCPDRTKYAFWDPFHPTESALLIGAKHILDGGLKYVSPINIRQLANL
ncbi:hypothetical protein GQ457_05G035570 [Hibiscus cannabinus]